MRFQAMPLPPANKCVGAAWGKFHLEVAPKQRHFGFMPVTLSIKNAPDNVVEALRQRARANHRSLQGELLAIIEEAARHTGTAPNRLDELMARVKARNLPQDGLRSVDIIRRERDRGWTYASNPNHHADTDADRAADLADSARNPGR